MDAFLAFSGLTVPITSGYVTFHLISGECTRNAVWVIMTFLNEATCIRNTLCSESFKWIAQFTRLLLSPIPWLIVRNQLYIYLFQPFVKIFILFNKKWQESGHSLLYQECFLSLLLSQPVSSLCLHKTWRVIACTFKVLCKASKSRLALTHPLLTLWNDMNVYAMKGQCCSFHCTLAVFMPSRVNSIMAIYCSLAWCSRSVHGWMWNHYLLLLP